MGSAAELLCQSDLVLLLVRFGLILLKNSNVWISEVSAKSTPLLNLSEDCCERSTPSWGHGGQRMTARLAYPIRSYESLETTRLRQ